MDDKFKPLEPLVPLKSNIDNSAIGIKENNISDDQQSDKKNDIDFNSIRSSELD